MTAHADQTRGRATSPYLLRRRRSYEEAEADSAREQQRQSSDVDTIDRVDNLTLRSQS